MAIPPPLHIPEKQFRKQSAEPVTELPALLAPRRFRTKVIAPPCVAQERPAPDAKSRVHVARLLTGDGYGRS